MIRIKGVVSEAVPLPDLKDVVWYQQEKVYSDDQYKKSLDLQREIQRGRLSIVERVEEKSSNFILPPIKTKSEPAKVDVSSLVSHIQHLEQRLEQNKPGNTDQDVLKALAEKIDQLEKKILGGQVPDTSNLLDIVSRIENKIEKTATEGIISRLEEIIKRAPVASQSSPGQTKMEAPKEVYVPNIKVEDANSHIQLKIRTIEGGNSVDSAAEALKKLRKKQ